jgi:hypothetical protein
VSALILAGVLVMACSTGCSTPMAAARTDFYRGQYNRALDALDEAHVENKDSVLFLMERGTIRQAAGNYQRSSTDFIAAADRLQELETYSVSKGAASLIVNDNVQSFIGTPFERTMLHDFTALNHLAVGNWENAAVESRRIIHSLSDEAKGDYPDDAFSRYVAGFGLEMIDDPSNAALQYRLAQSLAPGLIINENTGRIHYAPASQRSNEYASAIHSAPEPDLWPDADTATELVCFILLGRSPTGREVWHSNWQPGPPLHAEIRHKGQRLGRSYNLTDTAELAFETMEKQAMVKAAKTATRMALKEGLAQAVDSEYGDGWGDLVRIIFIGLLEQPDVRRWETLPRWLQVARVPCPEDLQSFEVIVQNQYGTPLRTIHVDYPVHRHRNTIVSLCRDLPVQPTTAPAE